MALVIADRVKESSTTTGTGAFTLSGALSGFVSFGSVAANGDTMYYAIQGVDAGGNPTGEWEVGLGSWGTGGILTRTTVYASSNAGSLVTFSAGTKHVWLDLPANWFVNPKMIGAINEAAAVTLASAATVSIGAAAANTINITGTTTITSFGASSATAFRRVIFSGALTLTHNATSLILPTGANITTAANDVAEFISLGGSNWRCIAYSRSSGLPLIGNGYSSRSSNTILTAADHDAFIDFTSGTFTQTLTAAATLGSKWFVRLRNSGTGTITLDPNLSETIDGATTTPMYPGEVRIIRCTGSAFVSEIVTPFNVTVTTTGAFTLPTGYSKFGFGLQAAGGGGSGGVAAGDGSGGGGGGGGAYREIFVGSSQISGSVTLTIGAGGNGGGAGANGGNGGNTSITGILGVGTVIVYGGGGGTASTVNTTPGVGGSGGGWNSAGALSTAGTGTITGYDNGLTQGASTVTMYGGAASASGGTNAPTNAATLNTKTRYGGGAGGASGGISASSAGNPSAGTGPDLAVGGAAGVSGTTPTSGSPGTYPKCGGGGGGSTITGATAGNGGNGGLGAGGGAGGVSYSGTDGNGGSGGSGYVQIWGMT